MVIMMILIKLPLQYKLLCQVSDVPDSPTIMDVLTKRVQEEVDLTNVDPKTHPRIFRAMHSIMVQLKAQPPEMIVPCILLTLPRLTNGWGACTLLPDGLPILRMINDEALKATVNEVFDIKCPEKAKMKIQAAQNKARQKADKVVEELDNKLQKLSSNSKGKAKDQKASLQ